MTVEFGKIQSQDQSKNASSNTLNMGIDKAPSSLIIKYITDMYSYPLEAAIRETISNAFDSINVANIDPNNGVRARVLSKKEILERTTKWAEHRRIDVEKVNDTIEFLFHSSQAENGSLFIVEDNGTGMTYDQLVETYTQYGVSDKRDNENVIGAFGLGAKSPLAYATEFHVITKTSSDNCLYLRAYRTHNDEFLAEYPVEIKGNEYSLVSHNNDDEQKLVITDPFDGDKTGTIVFFPIYNTDDSKARVITSAVDNLVCATGSGRISSQDNNSRFFKLAEFSIEDDNGNIAPASIFLSKRSFVKRAISFIKNGSDIAQSDDFAAFKVGNWIYPYNGMIWSASNATGYSLPNMEVKSDIVIEVPSYALSFVPSRDAIRNDNDNARTILELALETARAEIDKPEIISAIYNWACTGICGDYANIYGTNSLFRLESSKVLQGYYVDDSNGKQHFQETEADGIYTVRFFPRTRNGVIEDTRILLSACETVPGMSLTRAVSTPVLPCAMVESVNNNYKFRGFFGVDNRLPSMLFGPRVTYPKGSEVSGYLPASSVTVADNIVAYGDYNSCHGGHMGLGLENVSLTGVGKGKDGDINTCCIPYGLCIPGAAAAKFGEIGEQVLVIEAFREDISKIRKKLINIVRNKGIKEDICPRVFCVFIPPKAPESQLWEADELEQLKKDVFGTIHATKIFDNGNIHYISSSELPSLMEDIAQSKSESKKQDDIAEWRKMLSAAQCISIESLSAQTLRDAFTAYSPILKGKEQECVEDILNNSSQYAVIVTDDASERKYDAGVLYAETMWALGMIPGNITNILCIPDKNYNKSRRDMLVSSNIPILYDENKKVEEENIESGAFHVSAGGKVVFSGALPEYAVKQMIFRISTQWKREISNTISKAFCKFKTGIGSHNVLELESILTFGLVSEEDVEKPDGLHGWQREAINRISWNEYHGDDINAQKLAAEYAQYERQRADSAATSKFCLAIWGKTLDDLKMTIEIGKVPCERINDIGEIGKSLGVDLAIETLSDGVPIEDLYA